MSDGGASDQGSSDPPLVVNEKQELHSENEQLNCPDARVVKIPCKIMLDLMLEELTFPKARYDSYTDTRGRVSAVVTFYVSARMAGNLLQPIKMGGAEAMDSKMAEESAAKEAIRFVETWENMEVEDLHYSELKYVEGIREDLYIKLKSANEDKENLQRELCSAASRMVAFSNHLLSIIKNTRSLSEGDATTDMNTAIELFRGVASDLQHAGRGLKNNLKKLAEPL